MAHLHKKFKEGRSDYHVREIARVDGKPKIVNEVHLCWKCDAHKPQRFIEDPMPEQENILAALGFKIASGVLQPIGA